jgi:serine/threonine-protein kinase
LPFDAESLPKLVVRIATEVAPTPRSLRAEIPASLSRVIMRAIARQREDRTPNVETLIRELEPFATEQGFAAELAPTSITSPELKAEGPTPLAPDSGFLSQATKANTIQPALAATEQLASPDVVSPAPASERPYPLFGATQRRQRFAPSDLRTGTAADRPPPAAPLRSTPPRLKASTQHSPRRPFWIGALVATFILPLGFRLLRGPKAAQQAGATESTPEPAAARDPASDPKSAIPTTPSTRSADATEHDWDLTRPVQVAHGENTRAAEADNAQRTLIGAGASAPINVDPVTERPRRLARAARPDAGLVRVQTTVAASATVAPPSRPQPPRSPSHPNQRRPVIPTSPPSASAPQRPKSSKAPRAPSAGRRPTLEHRALPSRPKADPRVL